MAEITTALVHDNEIAKSDDFIHGFTSLIRNTAILDRMLVSAVSDYVIGGKVTPDAGPSIRVGKIYGNGHALDLPIYSDEISGNIPVLMPTENIRVDTVQVRAFYEEFDQQRRSFFDPDLTIGQYFVVPTKLRLKIEYQIKQGIEGQGVAPDADIGWIKLAEISLEPGMDTLPAENIRNVTAIYQGEDNDDWTNQKNRTFDLGSILDLKTMFAREHTVEGIHRQKVIKSLNIDFGVGFPKVNGKCIPLGKKIILGTDEFNAEDSLYRSLRREILYRQANYETNQRAIKQINQVISQILIAIDGLMPKAPGDGPLYGGQNKEWVKIEVSGGGQSNETNYLVTEDGDYLVTDDGDYLIIE